MPANTSPFLQPGSSVESSAAGAVANVYDDGHLRVEHDNYYVACEGRYIRLPKKEFLLVSRLVQSSERVVPAEVLWQHAWGQAARFNAESLHVHIYRLRRRLAPYNLLIETMINVGYRLHPATLNETK